MRLAVFTDLDGTLLDHATYSFEAARPALDRLRALEVPLVLASSKTAAEMAELHAALELGDVPAIVENGAGLLEPGQPAGGVPDDHARIRAALEALPPGLRAMFRGFADMSAAEVVDATGLSPEAATKAKQRQYSEPGLWRGDAGAEAEFVATLAEAGIHARSGGRFLTLSLGRTKADAMAEVIVRLGVERTIVLGDAPNDVEMLQAADHGVIIRNDHGKQIPALPGEATGTIRRSSAAGPAGWNAAVLKLLTEFGL